ncbi:MAG: Cys-tRNA(Pro) deacylase [Spirochaetia bacterium]|jgi:Cys-tRNA(Pro)/Cys-tRNA(Cys) deacylase|nr:Cys-tRNA(Pro) deacylase [Spirochaetia bacterium]
MSKGPEKTNAVRLAESQGVSFRLLSYSVDEDLSALHAAERLHLDPDRIFKTIIVVGERKGPFVCIIPGSCEIDFKKAAAAFGDKSCALLPLKELEPLTGYQRGGCSPLGMKKRLPTFLDETSLLFDWISVSAGRRGLQMLLSPGDLVSLSAANLADLLR